MIAGTVAIAVADRCRRDDDGVAGAAGDGDDDAGADDRDRATVTANGSHPSGSRRANATERRPSDRVRWTDP